MEFKNELLGEEIREIERIIGQEAQKKLMTYHSEEEISEAFSRGDALAVVVGSEIVGHVSLTCWENCVEITGLVIREGYRKAGIGRALFEKISEVAKKKYPTRQVIALTNEVSSQIASRCGFIPRKKEEIDQDVWGLCYECDEIESFPLCHCFPMVKEEVEIVKIDASELSLIKNMAEVYCEIWQEPPWREDFWTVEVVEKSIMEHLGKNKAIVLAAFMGTQVIGFSWGSVLGEEELRAVSSRTKLWHIFSGRREIFYVNELGVLKEKRGRKIGVFLMNDLIRRAGEENGLINFCLRTDEKAIAARKLYEKMGFCDLGIKDAKHSSRTYWLL